MRRQDVKALFLDRFDAAELGVLVGKRGVIKVRVAVLRFPLEPINVRRQILRKEAIKERSEDVSLEIPTVYASAQIVRDLPNRAMKFVPFLFF